MKKSGVIITLLALMTLLISCKQTIDADALMDKEETFMLFSNLQINNVEWGEPLAIINSDDLRFEKVQQWLNNNKKGWKNDFQTYEFPKLMLTGSYMNLCIYDGFVVLMYDDYYLTKYTDTKAFDFLYEGVDNTYSNKEEQTTIVVRKEE